MQKKTCTAAKISFSFNHCTYVDGDLHSPSAFPKQALFDWFPTMWNSLLCCVSLFYANLHLAPWTIKLWLCLMSPWWPGPYALVPVAAGCFSLRSRCVFASSLAPMAWLASYSLISITWPLHDPPSLSPWLLIPSSWSHLYVVPSTQFLPMVPSSWSVVSGPLCIPQSLIPRSLYSVPLA